MKMKEAASTEAEMREAKTPWPKTATELDSYIDSLVDRQHDYGTCAYAMSLAAAAAFNYVAHKLGTTGFQSGFAVMDFVRRENMIDGPFGFIKADDMVYPQYDIPAKVQEWLEEWKPWAAEQARKNLSTNDLTKCAPRVVEHWRKLAGETK